MIDVGTRSACAALSAALRAQLTVTTSFASCAGACPHACSNLTRVRSPDVPRYHPAARRDSQNPGQRQPNPFPSHFLLSYPGISLLPLHPLTRLAEPLLTRGGRRPSHRQ